MNGAHCSPNKANQCSPTNGLLVTALSCKLRGSFSRTRLLYKLNLQIKRFEFYSACGEPDRAAPAIEVMRSLQAVKTGRNSGHSLLLVEVLRMRAKFDASRCHSESSMLSARVGRHSPSLLWRSICGRVLQSMIQALQARPVGQASCASFDLPPKNFAFCIQFASKAQ